MYKRQIINWPKIVTDFEVGHLTPTFTFLHSSERKVVINAELHNVADTADVSVKFFWRSGVKYGRVAFGLLTLSKVL